MQLLSMETINILNVLRDNPGDLVEQMCVKRRPALCEYLASNTRRAKGGGRGGRGWGGGARIP